MDYSFYGGRRGTPFVIVQRFDGINIPQPGDGSGVTNYTYTKGVYAIDIDGNFILEDVTIEGAVRVTNGSDAKYLITKTANNYASYTWSTHFNDGTVINNTNYTFPSVLAKGMVQCFKQGTQTTNLVNYGEYVIIDTMYNLHESNNPDNGKIFRRGINVDTEYAGGEYIGQIMGPQGSSPELDIDNYEAILQNYPTSVQEGSYNFVNGGIVPGISIAGIPEDEIKYAYTTITDNFGNITGCLIGFKIPTLVQNFEGNSVSPYTKRVEGTSGVNSKYSNLIFEDPSQFIDGQWQHPFFQKWQVQIPQGYHGIDSTNIEVIHSYTMTPEYKGGDIEIYDDENFTSIYKTITADSTIKTYRILGSEYEYIDATKSYYQDYDKICNKYYIDRGIEYNADPAILYALIEIDGGIKYVKKEDCYIDILRYHEKDYDLLEQGVDRYFYIGDYDTVNRVTLSDDGTLVVFYSAQPQPKELEQVLRWIDTKNSDGITIDEDGTVHIYYNTVHSSDPTDPYEKLDDQGRAHDHQDYPTVLDWITEASLTSDGKFTIVYNNSTVKIGEDSEGAPIYGNAYQTTLKWIDYVDFNGDGTVTFRWNTDVDRNEEPPAYIFNNIVKYINDVKIENTKTDSADPRLDGYEGTGDQKIHVVYNNDGEADHAIGEPLNYIIETTVYHMGGSYRDGSKDNHLLVYYSDPELRLKLQDKWVTYPSTKILDEIPNPNKAGDIIQVPHVWKEWVDLGLVKGQSGSFLILTTVQDSSELYDATGQAIPPELLEDAEGNVINSEAFGWAVGVTTIGSATKEIMVYDYASKVWISLGTIDASAIDPRYVIDKSAPNDNYEPNLNDVGRLKEYGYWLASEKIYYAF